MSPSPFTASNSTSENKNRFRMSKKQIQMTQAALKYIFKRLPVSLLFANPHFPVWLFFFFFIHNIHWMPWYPQGTYHIKELNYASPHPAFVIKSFRVPPLSSHWPHVRQRDVPTFRPMMMIRWPRIWAPESKWEAQTCSDAWDYAQAGRLLFADSFLLGATTHPLSNL